MDGRSAKNHYYSLNDYLQQTYGEKIYRLPLNGGMTCPNRDGTRGTRGCIFCRNGSGAFAPDSSLSVAEQIEQGRQMLQKKYNGSSYIAYFQSYTNTYAPVSRLRALFTEAICHPDIRILSIATRPDCLDEEVLDLLGELNHIKPVWVELGLQTIHEKSAQFIRRGYPLPVFERAVDALHSRGIQVIVHTILGLPGEDLPMVLETMHYLNRLHIQGVKLQLLHVLKDTDLETFYRRHPFHILSMEEYFSLLGACLGHLRPDMVIHRLTGDGPKPFLIEPEWSCKKHLVINRMREYFEANDVRQGKEL